MSGDIKQLWIDEAASYEPRSTENRATRRRKEKLARQLTKELKGHGITDAAEVARIKEKVGLA